MTFSNYFLKKQKLKTIKNRPKIQKKCILAQKRLKKHHFLMFFNKKNNENIKEDSSEELFFNFTESETADQAQLFLAREYNARRD